MAHNPEIAGSNPASGTIAMHTERTSRHIHVPENAGCREHILIAEDLANKLNALLLEGAKRVEVQWLDLPDFFHDPTNRGYRIIASRPA